MLTGARNFTTSLNVFKMCAKGEKSLAVSIAGIVRVCWP